MKGVHESLGSGLAGLHVKGMLVGKSCVTSGN